MLLDEADDDEDEARGDDLDGELCSTKTGVFKEISGDDDDDVDDDDNDFSTLLVFLPWLANSGDNGAEHFTSGAENEELRFDWRRMITD